MRYRGDFHSGMKNHRLDQNKSYWCKFTPVTVWEQDFRSGTKTCSDVMQTWCDCWFQHEITLPGVWNGLRMRMII